MSGDPIYLTQIYANAVSFRPREVGYYFCTFNNACIIDGLSINQTHKPNLSVPIVQEHSSTPNELFKCSYRIILMILFIHKIIQYLLTNSINRFMRNQKTCCLTTCETPVNTYKMFQITDHLWIVWYSLTKAVTT